MRFSIYRGWGWVVPARMQTSCQHAYAITMPTLENSKISCVRLKKTLEIPEKSPEIPEFSQVYSEKT